MSDMKDLDLWLTELRAALHITMGTLTDAQNQARAGAPVDAISRISDARAILEMLVDSIDLALADARTPPS